MYIKILNPPVDSEEVQLQGCTRVKTMVRSKAPTDKLASSIGTYKNVTVGRPKVLKFPSIQMESDNSKWKASFSRSMNFGKLVPVPALKKKYLSSTVT